MILGRGSVAVLADRPDVLRVRLSGPAKERIVHAIELTGDDEATARATLRRLDRYHADYMREFYDVDIDDPALYHLALDCDRDRHRPRAWA